MTSSDNQNKIEEKIMTEIKSGRLKLRSRYVFLAERLGLGSVIVLTVLIAILFFSLGLFYMRETDNLAYLSFGRDGFLAFLESFPYLLVSVFVVCLFVAGYLIKKTSWSYKKPFGYVAIILIALVFLSGSVLALTDMNERIEEQVFEGCGGPGVIFKPFIEKGVGPRKKGVVGRIVEIGDDYLILESPHGLDRLDLSRLEKRGYYEKGDFVIAFGDRVNGGFMVQGIKAIERYGLPMIRRGVERCFEVDGNMCPLHGLDKGRVRGWRHELER